jgi:sirohydrochlorin cobaltochelatase
MKKGMLLFAHGARDAKWAEPFMAVLERVRQGAQIDVELGYLELMQPDFDTAVASLTDKGCGEIQVVPLFLGQGGHLKRDLPRLVEAARLRHQGVQFVVSKAAGESDRVLAALAGYCLEQAGR